MTVYIVVIEDQHCNAEVLAFHKLDDAMRCAKRYVDSNAQPGYKIEFEPIEGWEFFAQYNSEGDCVRVEEIEI